MLERFIATAYYVISIGLIMFVYAYSVAEISGLTL